MKTSQRMAKKRFSHLGKPAHRSFAYSILLDESETGTIREAMKFYAIVCNAKMESGLTCPYWAHLADLKTIEQKLCDSINKAWGEKVTWSHLV